MEPQKKHIPVMIKEVMEYLKPGKGGVFIDCTLGAGSYSLALSEAVGENGCVIGIDPDKEAIDHVTAKVQKNKINNLILANDNYKEIDKIFEANAEACKASVCNGVVFDLGLSQDQLEDRTRGFSFLLDAPLNMAFGQSTANENSTWRIVNRYKEKDIVSIIREFGEERFANRIAKGIVKARQSGAINTTTELVDVVRRSVPGNYINSKGVHFATRTFQALRIATNDELGNLESALPKALELLGEGGRLVVVSFHSLEDRIVKKYFKSESKDCICPSELPMCVCGHKAKLKILTSRVVIPTEEEISLNPKSRSAKLRAAEKI